MFNERNILNDIKFHKWNTPYVLMFLFSGFNVYMLFCFLKHKLKKKFLKKISIMFIKKILKQYTAKEKVSHLLNEHLFGSYSLIFPLSLWMPTYTGSGMGYTCACTHTLPPVFTKWGLYFYNLLLHELKKKIFHYVAMYT